ncbi:transposase [Bacillus cereus VD146]|uniref:Transposase n=2 Tax=Bacillus cereus TaxID=1396 RepID=R8NI81_BACCX|nr:transposase [Bacillus cereus VD146]
MVWKRKIYSNGNIISLILFGWFWCKNFEVDENGLSNLEILIVLLYKRCVISMEKENLFKWKHYQPDIILLTVRWYLRYNLSFRDLVEMMEERGLFLVHTTIMRWVHQYGPEFDKRIRRHLKQTNNSWRVDETYIKVKGQWMYLYRAVDSEGNTIDFYLSKSRNHKAAKRFFKKALRSFHVSKPRIITVDKNPAYPIAIEQLKKEKRIPIGTKIRRIKYLNNIVEQDHRFIKKRIRSMLGFKSYKTSASILSGVEAMHMVKKEQNDLQDQSVQNQNIFINQLFGLTA